MSTYANFFIEVKKNGKWELLQGYYPFEEKEHTEYDFEGKPRKIRTVPDLVCTNGIKLSKAEYLWRQGHVRDIFSSSYFNSAGLASRGLPEDVSYGVRELFNERMKKIEAEKAQYFEKYGQEKTWGGKWWWGETYATLDEMRNVLEKEYDAWKQNLLKAIDDKFTDSVLLKKSNEIYDLVNDVLNAVNGKKKGKKKAAKPDEEYDYPSERIDELIGDEIFDLLALNSFIVTIESVCELLTGEYDNEIRIIVWLD